MEFRFKVKGKQRRASPERVIESLRNVLPEPTTMYMVKVEGVAYPLKQAFCETFGIERHDLSTTDARRIMERLGFEVTREPVAERKRAPQKATSPPGRQRWMPRHGTQDPTWSWMELEIPTIVLNWSFSERWVDLAGIGEYSDEVYLPPGEPGIYRVYRKGHFAALYIGQTLNLRRRVVDGLVKGTLMHTAGQRIRENEDLSQLIVSWAVTDRPAAAEEELSRRHVEQWGKPPEYAGGG